MGWKNDSDEEAGATASGRGAGRKQRRQASRMSEHVKEAKERFLSEQLIEGVEQNSWHRPA